MEKANQALDPSDKANGLTAAEVETAADELQKTVESVRSAGLSTSHPLVASAAKASELSKSLRDKGTKIKVSALHVV